MAEPAKRDLYAILGVARDSDADALRSAYRKLARQYHPDVNPGDKAAEDRFKEISHAYDVLSDAEKRRNYDEFGEVSLEAGFDAKHAREARERFESRFGRGAQSGGFTPPGAESFEFGDLDDLLGRYFRSRGEEADFRARGSDVAASLELDLLDALRGGTQTLVFASPNASGGPRRSRCAFRPACATEAASAFRAAASPAWEAGPPATCGCASACERIRCSRARATISTSACRSASARRCSARRSRCRCRRDAPRCRCRPARTAGASCACAARAPAIPRRAKPAISTWTSRSACRGVSTKRRRSSSPSCSNRTTTPELRKELFR